MTDMIKLFAETYEDTAEGRASQLLAGVATTVEQYLGRGWTTRFGSAA